MRGLKRGFAVFCLLSLKKRASDDLQSDERIGILSKLARDNGVDFYLKAKPLLTKLTQQLDQPIHINAHRARVWTLSKFRGIRKEHFYLHLKETEFRYNTKILGENLYKNLKIYIKIAKKILKSADLAFLAFLF